MSKNIKNEVVITTNDVVTINHLDVFGPIVHPTTSKKRDYSMNEVNTSLLSKYGTKSDAIRGLLEEGHSISTIADLLNIRYQHVRNVSKQELKRKVLTITSDNKEEEVVA